MENKLPGICYPEWVVNHRERYIFHWGGVNYRRGGGIYHSKEVTYHTGGVMCEIVVEINREVRIIPPFRDDVTT